MMFAALLALLTCVVPSIAVFADDAYQLDYHFALLGLPDEQNTCFHQPYAGSKGSLLYTLSDKHVLGAVNPKDGSLVWRQALDTQNATQGFLRPIDGSDIVVSAAGTQVSAWSASDGRLVWTHTSQHGSCQDLETLDLEADTVTYPEHHGDALVLFGGSTPVVQRLHGNTGAVKWTFEDNSGDIPFQVSASTTHVYYTTLHSPLLGGLKIKVTSLDPLTGRKLDQYSLNSDSDLSSQDSILHVGANSASPILAWTDKKKENLKVNVFGSNTVSTFKIEQFMAHAYTQEDAVRKITLHAPRRATALPHFLVHFEGEHKHWGEVFHVDPKTSSVSKAYELPKWAGKGAFSTSSSDANVFFTRVTDTEVTLVSSASHGVLARWPVSAEQSRVPPVHAAAEVVSRAGSTYAVRQAVLLSTGDWILIHNGKPVWARPEYLSGASAAAWAELEQAPDIVHELELEGHSNIASAYVHRVKRHIKDLQHLPHWLEKLPKRLLQSFVGGSSDEPEGDPFGFHKLVVVATDNCRLVALDSGASGHVLWNVDIADAAVNGKCTDLSLEVAPEGFVIVQPQEDDPRMLFDVVSGEPLKEKDVEAIEAERAAPKTSMSVTYTLAEGELRGFLRGNEAAGALWRFAPKHGERILSAVNRPSDEPVASIGNVLGDRSVLYKYLNPNVVLATVANDAESTLSTHLLDGVTGETIYVATHDNVDTSRPVASAVSENWFSYSFTLGSAEQARSKGYQLVVSEMYESAFPNVRAPQSSSNFSTLEPAAGVGMPYTVSQTYHIPEEISDMAVTQTRQGITSRQLLVTLPRSNSIVGIPRAVIDPRRPVGRDPTATEVAEGLMRYTPMLEFDPKWYLNHKEELFGIKDVISSPASLESTSLVFAYGLDVFGTRVSPSFSFDMLGKGFNKLQMLATVAALGIGVLFVAPLVRRKQIDTRWQLS